MKHKMPLSSWFWLFKTHFSISAFTFGGGYIVIPMIRKFFVKEKHIFSEDELMNLAAIAQTSPGAIAVNLAVLSGYRMAGMAGAVISCIAAVFPPLIILSLLSACYLFFKENLIVAKVLKGMEAGVAAIIVQLVFDMTQAIFQKKQFFLSLLVPALFFASFFLQIPVAVLIPCSCIICFLVSRFGKI